MVTHVARILFPLILSICLLQQPQGIHFSKALSKASKSRILLVSHEFTATGAVGSLLDIRLLLQQEGYHVDFVCLEDVRHHSHSAAPNCSKIERNRPLFTNHQYDLILANTVVVDKWIITQIDAFGKDFASKLIWYIRELPIGDLAETLYLKNDFFLRQRIFDMARQVIFVSNASKNVYRKSFALDPRKVHVLPNPIEVKFLESNTCFKNNRKRGRRIDHRWRLGIHSHHTMVRQMVVHSHDLMPDHLALHSGSCYWQI